jgi:hypothetical protein
LVKGIGPDGLEGKGQGQGNQPVPVRPSFDVPFHGDVPKDTAAEVKVHVPAPERGEQGIEPAGEINPGKGNGIGSFRGILRPVLQVRNHVIQGGEPVLRGLDARRLLTGQIANNK